MKKYFLKTFYLLSVSSVIFIFINFFYKIQTIEEALLIGTFIFLILYLLNKFLIFEFIFNKINSIFNKIQIKKNVYKKSVFKKKTDSIKNNFKNSFSKIKTVSKIAKKNNETKKINTKTPKKKVIVKNKTKTIKLKK